MGTLSDRVERTPPFDVGSVIEKVSHYIDAAADGADAKVVSDAAYRARFDGRGLGVTLEGMRPARFGLSLSEISVGDRTMPIAARTWTTEGNVAHRDVHPVARERVTALDGRLEWDVVFDRRPAGHGDLRLEATVTVGGEPAPAAASARALRWDAGAGRSVEMGALVVKDRMGRQLYRAIPESTAGGLALEVPGGVLAGAAYPVTLDPVISPEYPVGDPVYGPAPRHQGPSEVAFDGTNYLVVWSDERGGAPDNYAARVSSSGVVLDPAGIAITDRNGGQASVAWNGSVFVVVWSSGTDLSIARVTSAGGVLDRGGKALGLQGNPFQPDIASGPVGAFVTWMDDRDGTEATRIYGSRLAADGSALDPSGILISSTLVFPTQSVTFDGTNFLVVWVRGTPDNSHIMGTRVRPSTGAVLDRDGFEISSGSTMGRYRPDVASNGSGSLVVWYQNPGYPDESDIRGALVGSGGAVDPGGTIPIETGAIDAVRPRVATNGSGYAVVWRDWRVEKEDVYAARLSGSGVLQDQTPIRITASSALETDPVVASGGGRYLLTWDRYTSSSASSYDVVGATLTAGSVSSHFLVSSAPNDQQPDDMVWNGKNFFVVWSDGRAGNSNDVYGARISADGTPLDGAGIAISTAPGGQSGAQVAWDGTNYLVAWSDSRNYWGSVGGGINVYGALVGSNGDLVRSDIPIAREEGPLEYIEDIAFDGSKYVAVWAADGSAGHDIKGAHIDRTGQRDNAFTISAAPGNQWRASLASNGTKQLVVYNDESTDNIYGAFIDSGEAGTPFPLTSAAAMPRMPAVASNGTSFLVAWDDMRTGTFKVYQTLVSSTGAVARLDGSPVSFDPESQLAPAAAAVGSTYVVAWENDTGFKSDVYATRISSSGAAVDSGGFPVAASSDGEGWPILSEGPEDQVWAGYSRRTISSGTDAWRGFLRSIRLPGETLTVNTTADNADGICDVSHCTLREAITAANSTPELDRVTFAIPGVGAHTIGVSGTGLPRITEPVVVEGTTQPGFTQTPVIAIAGSAAAAGTSGLVVAGSGSTIRALAVESFPAHGIVLEGSGGHEIHGTFVGTDTTGAGAASNGGSGVLVTSPNNFIGGDTAYRNVISGNAQHGILLSGGGRAVIKGNRIGVAADGTTSLGNGGDGVRLETSDNFVGGTKPEANLIAYNGGRGVSVSGAEATGNLVSKNAIFSNNGSGIDLEGVGANDVGDVDGGPNSGQNFPSITKAVSGNSETTIQGTMNGAPGSTFTLQLFSNDACDPSGYGEGQSLLVSTEVSTDSAGHAGFSVKASTELAVGTPLTAIALNASTVDTSEFSVCRAVEQAPSGDGGGGGGGSTVTPVTMTSPKKPFQTKRRFSVSWRPRDAGTWNYEIRTRVAGTTGRFSAFSTSETTSQRLLHRGPTGYTYCFSARSKDGGGDVSAWSKRACTAIPLNNKELTHKRGWVKRRARGYYLRSYSESKRRGARLTERVRARRLAVVATTCPRCGTIKVLWNKRVVKRIRLVSPRLKKKHLINAATFRKVRRGIVKVVVRSRGKVVRIGGVGVSRV